MWFFDAKVWQEADLRIFELTEIHRQHEADFKYMLNAVRHGQVTKEIADRLNEVGARPAPDDGTITLATRNDTVNRINAQALAPAARPRAHGEGRGQRRLRRPRLSRPTRRSSSRSARR